MRISLVPVPITNRSMASGSRSGSRLRLEQKAISLPSGDQHGAYSSWISPSVNCMPRPVLTFTVQICQRSLGKKPISSSLKKTRLMWRETTPNFFFRSSFSRSTSSLSFLRRLKTNSLPWGDHWKSPILPFTLVNCRASPPWKGMM